MRPSPKPRVVRYTAFPLYATPRPWPWKTDAKELSELSSLARLKKNAVTLAWRDRTSLFAALSCGADPPYTLFRLVRLKKDSIDRIDLERLEESLLRPGPNEWLGESVHFVLNTRSWIALGEHDPQIVSVLGNWPETLLNRVFASAGHAERAEFHPFMSDSFREVVCGKAIDKFIIKMGPASSKVLQEEGFKASAIEDMIADDLVTNLDITITVAARKPADEKRIFSLERLGAMLKRSQARAFKIRTDEGTIFNMLGENFVSYDFNALDDPQASQEQAHKVVLYRLLELARGNEVELKSRLPSLRSIESFFGAQQSE